MAYVAETVFDLGPDIGLCPAVYDHAWKQMLYDWTVVEELTNEQTAVADTADTAEIAVAAAVVAETAEAAVVAAVAVVA